MYKLPLSPIDLTSIYKKKLNESDTYVLLVDYAASKEVLTTKQILMYLSNTGFKCAFSEVDNELIEQYLQLNFLVDSPLLSRIVGNIVMSRLGESVDESYNNDFVNKFDSDTINDLTEDLSGLMPFIINSINDLDNEIEIDIETSGDHDNDSLVGLNILNIIVHCTDAVMGVIKNLGFKTTYNSNIFNNESKYEGKDIFAKLNDNNIVSLIYGFIPKEVISESSS